MDDLISRQAAIDKFEPWLKVEGYSEGELNMLKAVLYELRFIPSIQPRKWIPCSERLPEVGEYVLCSQDNGDVGEGKLLDYGSWFICYDQTCRGDYWVKAWAPLPDRYKGEE